MVPCSTWQRNVLTQKGTPEGTYIYYCSYALKTMCMRCYYTHESTYLFLFLLLVFFFFILTLIMKSSTDPSLSQFPFPTLHSSPNWYYPRGDGNCKRLDSFTEPAARAYSAQNIVFSFQMPHRKFKRQLDFSRWQQSLMGIMTFDIEYQDGVEHEKRYVRWSY